MVAIFDAFNQVFQQKKEVAVFPELLYMGQLMPNPLAVIDKLLARGIVQQNGFAQHHGHFILLQLFGCQPGEERVFFDIVLQFSRILYRRNNANGRVKVQCRQLKMKGNLVLWLTQVSSPPLSERIVHQVNAVQGDGAAHGNKGSQSLIEQQAAQQYRHNRVDIGIE